MAASRSWIAHWTSSTCPVTARRSGNQAHRRQGQLDSPLTEHGRAQAEAIGAALEGRAIEAIFHSPLGGAAETARIIATRLQLPPVEISDLAEVHHGAMAGLTDAQIDQRHPGAFAQRTHDKFNWCFPEGESYADGDVRARAALEAIADTGVRQPVLVSHEMIGRMLLKQLLRLEPSTALAESHPNDVVHVVEPSTGGRSILRATTGPASEPHIGANVPPTSAR